MKQISIIICIIISLKKQNQQKMHQNICLIKWWKQRYKLGNHKFILKQGFLSLIANNDSPFMPKQRIILRCWKIEIEEIPTKSIRTGEVNHTSKNYYFISDKQWHPASLQTTQSLTLPSRPSIVTVLTLLW